MAMIPNYIDAGERENKELFFFFFNPGFLSRFIFFVVR